MGRLNGDIFIRFKAEEIEAVVIVVVVVVVAVAAAVVAVVAAVAVVGFKAVEGFAECCRVVAVIGAANGKRNLWAAATLMDFGAPRAPEFVVPIEDSGVGPLLYFHP